MAKNQYRGNSQRISIENLKQSSEANEQRRLMEIAGYYAHRYPELSLLYHVPNEGKRSKITGSILKSQGLKAGVPDLCLPVARGVYHGLYIELKYGKNKLSDNQKQWLTLLGDQRYFAVACWGGDQAFQTLLNYLNLEDGKFYSVQYWGEAKIEERKLTNKIKFLEGIAWN